MSEQIGLDPKLPMGASEALVGEWAAARGLCTFLQRIAGGPRGASPRDPRRPGVVITEVGASSSQCVVREGPARRMKFEVRAIDESAFRRPKAARESAKFNPYRDVVYFYLPVPSFALTTISPRIVYHRALLAQSVHLQPLSGPQIHAIHALPLKSAPKSAHKRANTRYQATSPTRRRSLSLGTPTPSYTTSEDGTPSGWVGEMLPIFVVEAFGTAPGLFLREVDLSGSGNGEFEMTTGSINNSFLLGGNLYIVPTLTVIIPRAPTYTNSVLSPPGNGNETGLLRGNSRHGFLCSALAAAPFTLRRLLSPSLLPAHSVFRVPCRHSPPLLPFSPSPRSPRASLLHYPFRSLCLRLLPPLRPFSFACPSSRHIASFSLLHLSCPLSRLSPPPVRTLTPLTQLWPTIWMLPVTNAYGPWRASGKIDIAQLRGNGAALRRVARAARPVARGFLLLLPHRPRHRRRRDRPIRPRRKRRARHPQPHVPKPSRGPRALRDRGVLPRGALVNMSRWRCASAITVESFVSLVVACSALCCACPRCGAGVAAARGVRGGGGGVSVGGGSEHGEVGSGVVQRARPLAQVRRAHGASVEKAKFPVDHTYYC
ncbi:hypothetical protein B0H11DRAFT_2260157 [Mycena galericulata]|nr:hypothetical protein B0H11DRAFT_2260157 [Mycena galericulata]